MEAQSLAVYAVPILVAAVWYALSPLFVSLGNPRLSERNPDRFAKLVRFFRWWGLLAVVVGFAIAFIGAG